MPRPKILQPDRIAPVLIELVRLTDAQLDIEYSIDAGAQLRGELDYFLSQGEHLLVIEAKNADLTRGLTELAVELIALHR